MFCQTSVQKDSLKLILKTTKSDTTKCNLLNKLIEDEYDETVWPKYNEQLGEIAKAHVEKIKSTKTITDKFYLRQLSNHYNNNGYLAMLHHGDTKKAIEWFNNALKIDIEIDNKLGMASNYNSLAVVYSNTGDKKKTLEYYYKSLKISEEINDKNNLAIVLTNIAKIQHEEGDKENALENMHKSLKLRLQLGNQNGIANSYNNLATVYSKNKEFDKAQEYYTKSLEILEKSHDKIGIANVNWNLGNLYIKRKKIDCDSSDEACKKNALLKAKEYYVKSLHLHQESGNKRDEADVLTSIGWLDFTFLNIAEAERCATQALQLGEELGFPKVIKEACNLLYEIEAYRKNWESAFSYYKKYVAMKDSINSDENTKASVKEQLKYDYEKQAIADSIRMDGEKKLISAKLSEEKTKSYALYGGLAVVVLFAAFMFNRFKVTSKQKQIIELKEKETQKQKELIEEKQKEIVDSINYAKRIQYTLLAHAEFLKANLPEHFISFIPKDIVSGDFYWATKKDNKFYLAICDSTGHGVPGAFMSLLNISFLNEAITERNISEPNKIFDYVRQRLIDNMNKEGQKDGFDGTLICIEGNKVTYASANNKPILIHNNDLIELGADRMPVGIGEKQDLFKLHELDVVKGDTLYLYTDGYADQFGGLKGKKFKYKQLNELILKINTETMYDQKMVLEENFNLWKNNLEQVDDVCVVGIKF